MGSRLTTKVNIPVMSTDNLGYFDFKRYQTFTIYKGIMVFFDDDQDTRVLTFIDDLSIKMRQKLFAVGESEGSLTLVWNCHPPKKYQQDEYVHCCGDDWFICESVRYHAEEPIKHEVPLPFVPVDESVCIVRGDSYMIRKWLSEVGFTFDSEAKAWTQTVQIDQYGRGLFCFKYSDKQVPWTLTEFIEACPAWDKDRKLSVSFE